MQLAHLFENNGTPEEHAFKLAVLFGNKQKALEYITKTGSELAGMINKDSLSKAAQTAQAELAQLVHNALLLNLPPIAKCDFATWRILAEKYLINNIEKSFKKVLPFADVIEDRMNKVKNEKPKSTEVSSIRKDLAEQLARLKALKNCFSRWRNLIIPAIKNSDVEMMQALIDIGVEARVNGKGEGATLLQLAFEGHRRYVHRMVTTLIENGANVNANYGEAPLALALKDNRSDIILTLIDKGADVNVPIGNDRDTPLLVALKKSCPLNVIQAFLDKNANVNQSNWIGQTPLALALQKELPTQVIQSLIDKGANVNPKTSDLIMDALRFRMSTEVIQLLIDNGAKVPEDCLFDSSCYRLPLNLILTFLKKVLL